MSQKRKYGVVKSQPVPITIDSNYTVQGKTRSYLIRNLGTSNVDITLNGGKFPLASGDAQSFGGYDDALRVDDLKFEFGAGTNLVIIFQDVLTLEPSYIQV